MNSKKVMNRNDGIELLGLGGGGLTPSSSFSMMNGAQCDPLWNGRSMGNCESAIKSWTLGREGCFRFGACRVLLAINELARWRPRPTILAASDGLIFIPRCSSQYSGQLISGRKSPRITCEYQCMLISTRVFSSYEDFAECFSLWCEEQPDGAKGIFSGVARHIENEITVSAKFTCS